MIRNRNFLHTKKSNTKIKTTLHNYKLIHGNYENLKLGSDKIKNSNSGKRLQ